MLRRKRKCACFFSYSALFAMYGMHSSYVRMKRILSVCRRCKFPFRIRSLPFETVDAISQETAMRNGIDRFKWQRPFTKGKLASAMVVTVSNKSVGNNYLSFSNCCCSLFLQLSSLL